MSSETELLERIYAEWGRGDYSSGEFLHPEFELTFAPGFLDEGVFTGPAEAWRGWREWLEQWETWNYELVHVHGTLRAHHDPAWVEAVVRELTARHEGSLPAPWSVDDAPADYLARMLRAIVGVSLEVTRVEAKRKLSQNRGAGDVAGVVAGLRRFGDGRAASVADAMADVAGAPAD